VFGAVPRALAAVGSGLGATVVIVGAVWSAQRLLRAQAGASVAGRGRGGLAPRRLALANALIALGTLTISFKRPFVALSGSDETGFALALAAGLAVIFGGFLLTAAGPPRPASGSPGPSWNGPSACPDHLAAAPRPAISSP
jgi:hypothetical protein